MAAPPPPVYATLLRVKRQRTDHVEDELVVEEVAPVGLGDALGALSLGATGAVAAAPAPKRRRYVRLSTWDAAALSSLTPGDLQALVKARGEATETGEAGRGPVAEAAAASAAGSALPYRYEQIPLRAGETLFERTEYLPDALRGWAGETVDVVRHAGGEQYGTAPAAAAETADMDASGSPAASDSEQTREYVYDVYVATEVEEGRGESGEGEDEAAAAAWEAHLAGRAPVLQIRVGDSWLVHEMSDRSDSDADSADSNAEGFFANDYGEEGSDRSSSGESGDPGLDGPRRWRRADDSDDYSDHGSY